MAAAKSFDLDAGEWDRERADFEARTERDRAEWRTRGVIGYILLGLLIGIVVCGFLALYVANSWPAVPGSADDAEKDAVRLLAFMNVVFGPVVTLVGSVTGFYFGAKTAGTAVPPKAG